MPPALLSASPQGCRADATSGHKKSPRLTARRTEELHPGLISIEQIVRLTVISSHYLNHGGMSRKINKTSKLDGGAGLAASSPYLLG